MLTYNWLLATDRSNTVVLFVLSLLFSCYFNEYSWPQCIEWPASWACFFEWL